MNSPPSPEAISLSPCSLFPVLLRRLDAKGGKQTYQVAFDYGQAIEEQEAP
jgi:hypothetical protein